MGQGRILNIIYVQWPPNDICRYPTLRRVTMSGGNNFRDTPEVAGLYLK